MGLGAYKDPGGIGLTALQLRKRQMALQASRAGGHPGLNELSARELSSPAA